MIPASLTAHWHDNRAQTGADWHTHRHTRKEKIVSAYFVGDDCCIYFFLAVKKRKKKTTQGRDGRTARRHHTGILRRGAWC